jgi:hypothetical protein
MTLLGSLYTLLSNEYEKVYTEEVPQNVPLLSPIPIVLLTHDSSEPIANKDFAIHDIDRFRIHIIGSDYLEVMKRKDQIRYFLNAKEIENKIIHYEQSLTIDDTELGMKRMIIDFTTE